MNDYSEDKKQVSQAYHAMSQSQETAEPLSSVDVAIKAAATRPVNSESFTKYRFRNVAIAAAVVLTMGVVLNVAFIDQPASDAYSSLNDEKRPMYMLQRSKPVSASIMMEQINSYLDQGEISKARQLHKKFRYFYPDFNVDTLISEKLKQHNII